MTIQDSKDTETLASTTPLDLVAVRRHILSQLGIGLWVDKNTHTQQTEWACRMKQSNAQLGSAQPIHIQLSSTQSNKSTVADEPLAKRAPFRNLVNQDNLLSAGNKSSALGTPQTVNNEKTVFSQTLNKSLLVNPQHAAAAYLSQIVVTATHFRLLGIRYRHWILLADGDFMTTKTHGIWQSLQTKLEQEATKSGVKFLSHSTDYTQEQDSYREYESKTNLANPSLSGFLLKLLDYQADIGVIRFALLTPLGDKISLGKTIGHLILAMPTLDMMADDPLLKKDVWQMLHSKLT